MKRTTYIIIGLFVLGLLLIPVLLRTPAGEKVARRLSMEGERTEIEMAGIRHVKIVEKLGKIDKDGIGIAGQLDVQASPALGKSIFAYPKSKYLNVTQEGDCLLIEVDMDNEGLSQIVQSLDKGRILILDGLNLELKADFTLLSIENRAVRVDGSILLLVKSDREPGAVKLLSMKEAGFLPQNRTFPPREENVSITFQADAEITSDDGIINVSYLCPLLCSR